MCFNELYFTAPFSQFKENVIMTWKLALKTGISVQILTTSIEGTCYYISSILALMPPSTIHASWMVKYLA